ncbi:hypothetical protein [Streptomyces sp. NPDC003077]|uniref:hypothetical protein n=1 Tax=Streptomyces sp. NPDC003077 TaxID=3154443 RepID=UPI0033A12CB9
MAHAYVPFSGKDLDDWLYEAHPVPDCGTCAEQWELRRRALTKRDGWGAFWASQAIRRHPNHR